MRRICVLLSIFCVSIPLSSASLGMVGAYGNSDPNRDDVQQMATFAHKKIESSSNALYATKLLGVEEVQVQVVSGLNYKMKLRIGLTNCMKSSAGGENSLGEGCPVDREQLCDVVVWYRSWEEKSAENPQIMDQKCEEIKDRKKRSINFEAKEVDKESEMVTGAADHVVMTMNDQSQGLYSVQRGRVVSAKSKVVAGALINITFEITISSCENKFSAVSTCDEKPLKQEVTECEAMVWFQAWRSPQYELKHYKCSTDALRQDNTLRFSSQTNKTPKLNYWDNLVAGMSDKGFVDERPLIGYELKHFETFKAQYGRQYKSKEEESQRYEVFRANMRRAQVIQDHDLGDARYGATQFADYTPEEFKKFVNSRPWNRNYDSRMKPAAIPNDEIPKSFDWRDKGAVTEVKNQGSCGSCWAFSVTGNIEGQWYIGKKSLVSLSEQELVDCDKLDEGCNGGLPSNAYEEIQRLGGLETEQDYPYKGEDEKCVFLKDHVKVYINGSVNISKNEDDMAKWLVKNGPMSIGINAMAMQFYFGGVSHPWKLFCPDALDHGVLIVGYGVKKGHIFGDTPYWIVKNSWGAHWGEKGYYLVYRGDGTCGLNEMVSSAVIR